MSFADAYLLKAGLRGKLIETEPHPELKIIVTIPVHNESGLERCLDSLFQCQVSAGICAEILILINAPVNAPQMVLEQNLDTYDAILKWIAVHPHPSIDFHLMLDHSFDNKDAGVGMARKILMDEATRRFGQLDRTDGIIASMDADAVVEENYLEAIMDHFTTRQTDGCSIYFEHPLESGHPSSDDPASSTELEENFEPEVYAAIAQYELHLRYYLQSVRFTGYPNAFHTVGSSFAVNADVYRKEGGMNRRKGGEDFYFIQKVAQRGNYSECITTCVYPSPRPSSRVPFGTGPVIGRLVKADEQLKTYDPRPFGMLGHLFSGLQIMYTEVALDDFMKSQPSVLLDFLEKQLFGEARAEIRTNSASFPAFRKRFWRWFNMFRIMKFLHHARENGFPDILVEEASIELLNRIKSERITTPSNCQDVRELLMIYRQLER